MQLRNVIERSGMVAYCDFVEKESAQTDEGRRVTPDMIVRLPNGASIVVDSKVPIDAYLTAADAMDEHVREPLRASRTRFGAFLASRLRPSGARCDVISEPPHRSQLEPQGSSFSPKQATTARCRQSGTRERHKVVPSRRCLPTCCSTKWIKS